MLPVALGQTLEGKETHSRLVVMKGKKPEKKEKNEAEMHNFKKSIRMVFLSALQH